MSRKPCRSRIPRYFSKPRRHFGAAPAIPRSPGTDDAIDNSCVLSWCSSPSKHLIAKYSPDPRWIEARPQIRMRCALPRCAKTSINVRLTFAMRYSSRLKMARGICAPGRTRARSVVSVHHDNDPHGWCINRALGILGSSPVAAVSARRAETRPVVNLRQHGRCTRSDRRTDRALIRSAAHATGGEEDDGSQSPERFSSGDAYADR